MRTSPRANMRGDVLSSQPARLARKGRCQGAAVRATRETSRGAATTKRAPDAKTHSTNEGGEEGDTKTRKARTREKPAKRAPPRPGRERQGHGGQPRQSAPRTRTRIHQEKRRRAGRQDAKGKVTGRPTKRPSPRAKKQEHGKSPQSAPRRAPGANAHLSRKAAKNGHQDAKSKNTGKARKARPPRPGHERQGHGEAVTKKRALARMRSLPPGVAMRAARAPCVVSPSQSRRMESRHACSPRHGAFRRSAFFPGG